MVVVVVVVGGGMGAHDAWPSAGKFKPLSAGVGWAGLWESLGL